MTPAQGFAVELDGVIQLQTVAATEQGAQVKGLLTIFGVTVYGSWSHTQIEEAWHRCVVASVTRFAIAVVPVTVSRSLPN